MNDPLLREQVIQAVAKVLDETRPEVIESIGLVADRLGGKQAIDMARAARIIHNAGGLYTNMRNRKRSMGGVFFWLARWAMTEDDCRAVWPDYKHAWWLSKNKVRTDKESLSQTEPAIDKTYGTKPVK